MFAGYTFEGSKPKHAAPASCPATKGLPPASAIAEWRNRNEKQMADRGGEVAFSALPGCAVRPHRWYTRPRDFSLRRPTLSQERKGKKRWRPAPFEMTGEGGVRSRFRKRVRGTRGSGG